MDGRVNQIDDYLFAILKPLLKLFYYHFFDRTFVYIDSRLQKETHLGERCSNRTPVLRHRSDFGTVVNQLSKRFFP